MWTSFPAEALAPKKAKKEIQLDYLKCTSLTRNGWENEL
jgi:hypothetical protein